MPWQGQRIVAPGTEPGDWPCVMRLTFPRERDGKVRNGKTIRVRCECMAQTLLPPSPRFTGYDALGDAHSLGAAIALWRDHAAAKRAARTADG